MCPIYNDRVNQTSTTTMQPLQPASKALISRIRKLQSHKGREESGRFPAEGTKVVRECLSAGMRCHALIFADDFPAPVEEELRAMLLPLSPATMAVMERSDFDRLCGTQSPQGVLGEFDQPAMPELSLLESGLPLIIILDGVQDPGNVGTSIRVAAGLGAEGLLLTPGCADLWNPKVVRASAGAVFRIPVWKGIETSKAIRILMSAGYAIWIADATGEPLFKETKIPTPLALVLGNEAHGASPAWFEAKRSQRIGLPMAHGVESLNVGTALAAMLGWMRGTKTSLGV